MLTLVIFVVASPVEDLMRTSEVEEVKVRLEDEEHLDRVLAGVLGCHGRTWCLGREGYVEEAGRYRLQLLGHWQVEDGMGSTCASFPGWKGCSVTEIGFGDVNWEERLRLKVKRGMRRGEKRRRVRMTSPRGVRPFHSRGKLESRRGWAGWTGSSGCLG